MIHICGPKDSAPPGAMVLNTTSRSKDWGRAFSPFLLGPVDLYGNYTARNVENAWQYCKVYKEHVDANGNPSEEYFQWAESGWNNPAAQRYPMGKGIKPKYSYWDGEALTYVEARKKIYIPIYSKAVATTEAFLRLADVAKSHEVWLWDFDGYNHEALGIPLSDVVEYSGRKCGHAFVLKMMLTCGGLEKWANQWWQNEHPGWAVKARIARNKHLFNAGAIENKPKENWFDELCE